MSLFWTVLGLMEPSLFALRMAGAPVARFFAHMVARLCSSQWLLLGYALWWQHSGKKEDAYNMLWALVFGFATLNILGLGARRLDPRANRLSFGELLAIMVVIASVFLLGWEMLNLFKIFPIKLRPR